MKNGCLRTLVIAGLIGLAAGGVTAADGMQLGGTPTTSGAMASSG